MSTTARMAHAAGTLALALALLAWAALPARGGQNAPLDTAALDALVAGARGRVVLVNFWASWCGPCRREFPDLERLRRAVPAKDLLVAGVSLDFDRDMYERFARSQGFTYPIYLADESLMDQLDIDAIPKTLIYDRRGKLAANHDGPVGFAELHALVNRLIRADLGAQQ